ncbi:hypothetical protein B0H14DRAFT_3873267 [Mycena olivaceomarginata]|nr:hypothetical protein B0H14DRAFT_3873267 [Mycena olivaceomarginata]
MSRLLDMKSKSRRKPAQLTSWPRILSPRDSVRRMWLGRYELRTFTCVTNQGAGPLEADCVALENALPAFAATQSNPFSFTVLPQFVQEFTLGTCLWAWINTNPIGGAILQYCYVGVEANGITLDGNCIFPGDTAGIAIPSNPQLNPVVLAWAFEVLHS